MGRKPRASLVSAEAVIDGHGVVTRWECAVRVKSKQLDRTYVAVLSAPHDFVPEDVREFTDARLLKLCPVDKFRAMHKSVCDELTAPPARRYTINVRQRA